MKIGTNNIVSVWFGFVMVALLLSGAVVFTFTDFMADTLYGNRRTFFILMLLAYLVYRSVRIYQVLKRNRED